MDYSFTASGTKTEVADTLGAINTNGDVAFEEAVKFAGVLVASDVTQPDSDSHEVRYSIASSCRPEGAGLPYVSFSYAVSYAAKEV